MATSSLTTGQLLPLARPNGATPPPGFVPVPADKLVLPAFEAGAQQAPRINYTAWFNPGTNELILSGTPKPSSWRAVA